MSSSFVLPGEDVVHLWRCSLSTLNTATRVHCLDADERRRANAFVFERDRSRFIAGRVLLRSLLGAYLDLDAAEVDLTVATNGKPRLAEDCGIHFNISHCADTYVAAFSCSEDIGIDVEAPRDVTDARELARIVFSEEECRWLEEMDPRQVSAAFQRGWTRKEAFVKARGLGLGTDLKRITVGLETARRVIAPIPGISDGPLVVDSIQNQPGFVAVAYPEGVKAFQYRDISTADQQALGL